MAKTPRVERQPAESEAGLEARKEAVKRHNEGLPPLAELRGDPDVKQDAKPAEPVTPAAGAFEPDRPGTVAEHEANKERKAEHPTFPVKFVKGYYPGDDKAKIPIGTEKELPIEEARYLIESGVAVPADQLP